MVCKESELAAKESVVCGMLDTLGERCTCNGIAAAWKSEYLCRKSYLIFVLTIHTICLFHIHSVIILVVGYVGFQKINFLR